MPKSFYELDYLIEVNEQRVEQFTSAYQKVTEKFTNIIIIYSALSIFLVSIIQDIFVNGPVTWFLYISFTLFAVCFAVSIVYTIRLIIPVDIAYLESPKVYYDTFRLDYEKTYKETLEIDKLLKASYINELEKAATANEQVFRRKSHFYYWALVYGLLSAIPYLTCLGYHISQKEDKVNKVQLVNSIIDSSLQQNKGTMSRHTEVKPDSAKYDAYQSNYQGGTNHIVVGSRTNRGGTVSNLPGVDSSKVLPSNPKMIREDSPNYDKHHR